ncbi:unnamed protein product [Heterobilharzia americana]|nr:unnamed protein product [Heterobilharzia americana]
MLILNFIQFSFFLLILMEVTGDFLTSSTFIRDETTEQPSGPAPTPAEKTLTRIIFTINDENLVSLQNSIEKCRLTIMDLLNILENLEPYWSK